MYYKIAVSQCGFSYRCISSSLLRSDCLPSHQWHRSGRSERYQALTLQWVSPSPQLIFTSLCWPHLLRKDFVLACFVSHHLFAHRPTANLLARTSAFKSIVVLCFNLVWNFIFSWTFYFNLCKLIATVPKCKLCNSLDCQSNGVALCLSSTGKQLPIVLLSVAYVRHIAALCCIHLHGLSGVERIKQS